MDETHPGPLSRPDFRGQECDIGACSASPPRHLFRQLLGQKLSAAALVFRNAVQGSDVLGSFDWSGEILAGRSTESTFAGKLLSGATDKIENELRTVQSIDQFAEYTKHERDILGHLGYWAIERYPRYQGVLLSALGRFEEAYALLDDLIERDEARYLAELDEGRALIAKRSTSRIGKEAVEDATRFLAIIAELKRLLALLGARDRRGVGVLLREWEQRNAKLWRVEHLWEPTPFPVERGDH